jgi:hypothetical protein
MRGNDSKNTWSTKLNKLSGNHKEKERNKDKKMAKRNKKIQRCVHINIPINHIYISAQLPR